LTLLNGLVWTTDGRRTVSRVVKGKSGPWQSRAQWGMQFYALGVGLLVFLSLPLTKNTTYDFR
jgi:hypothetical protein